jgi:hypothetical protein
MDFEIDYNFPVKINKNYHKVKKECSKWLLEYKIFNYKKTISIVNDFTLLTSLTHPYSNYQKLLVLSKHFIWIFVIDDVAENYGNNTEYIISLYKNILKIIENKNIYENLNVYTKMFYDIWKSLDLSDILRKRFFERFNYYVNGVIEESKNINSFINENTYYINRRKTSEVHVVALLIEFDINEDNEDIYKICKNETINILNMSFVDITFIINDIYSFKKEYNDNYFMNLVYIIHKENNCDINTSINKCINKLNNEIMNFEETVIKIKQENIEYEKNIDKYIIGLKYWISGFLFWSKISQRYHIE